MEVTAFAPLPAAGRRVWRAPRRPASIAYKAIAFPIWENCIVARTGKPATRQVAAVQRAIAILDELAGAQTELGPNEIGRRAGINVSPISRILATLVGGGLVDHVPATGRYRLGAGIARLASAAGRDIRSLARPHLEELGRRLGETVTLSVPGEHEA